MLQDWIHIYQRRHYYSLTNFKQDPIQIYERYINVSKHFEIHPGTLISKVSGTYKRRTSMWCLSNRISFNMDLRCTMYMNVVGTFAFTFSENWIQSAKGVKFRCLVNVDHKVRLPFSGCILRTPDIVCPMSVQIKPNWNSMFRTYILRTSHIGFMLMIE